MKPKVWQINGCRIVVDRGWGEWISTHEQEGILFSGADKTLSGLRKGAHVMTGKIARAWAATAIAEGK